MVKLFMSGINDETVETSPLYAPLKATYRLLSCYEGYLSYCVEATPQTCVFDRHVEVMYDSGAFTAWSKGEEVTLPALIDTYSMLLDRFSGLPIDNFWLINLDKIPGSRGVDPTPEEIVECIKISDENYEVLKDKFGEIVLPVFHQGENLQQLDAVVRQNPYICVSPRNDLPEANRRAWSLRAHAHIPAGTRTHGLAATGWAMMNVVPWSSVDSSSWNACARYGGVYFEPAGLKVLTLSKQSGARFQMGHHIDNVTKVERDAFLERVHEWGFKLEEMVEDYRPRMIWNRLCMARAAEMIAERKEQPQSKTTFQATLFGV